MPPPPEALPGQLPLFPPAMPPPRTTTRARPKLAPPSGRQGPTPLVDERIQELRSMMDSGRLDGRAWCLAAAQLRDMLKLRRSLRRAARRVRSRT